MRTIKAPWAAWLSPASVAALAALSCADIAPPAATDLGLGSGGLVGTGGSSPGGATGTGGTPDDAPTGGSASGGAEASGGAGIGGPGPTGGGGSGGSDGGSGGSEAATDCNDVTDQPVLVVAQDGSGDHATVQAALDTLSGSNTTPTQLRIQPGTYEEKLRVQKPYVTLCGQTGQEAATVLTYADTNSTPNESGGTLGTSGSASIDISASDISVENLTMENSHGPGIQAVALLVTGSRVEFRKVLFKGYQDTLYVKSGSQYFRECYVEGSVDFIFGAATAVFEDCSVHSLTQGTAVVAPNTDEATPYGLVFLGGELTGEPSLELGSIALGRNWGAYGAAAFIEVELGPHISGVGWVPMGENTLSTARFAEFESSGQGAAPGARAMESTQLTPSEAAEYTVDEILSPWVPSFSD
jgi:pectin methylesterase-like acyl-CoA thioesterase